MELKKITVGELETNCYIFGCSRTKKAFIIDPGAEPDKIKRAIKEMGVEPVCVVNTHGHLDHIGADGAFDLPVFIHAADAECLTNPARNLSSMFYSPVSFKPAERLLADGEEITAGDIILRVIHTPGHTPGGICLWCEKENLVFSGDTLFYCGYGRTDLPGGDETELFASLREKLFVLPEQTFIYPGHGPRSTIDREKGGCDAPL